MAHTQLTDNLAHHQWH